MTRLLASLRVFLGASLAVGALAGLAALTGQPLVFPSLGPTALLSFWAPELPSSSPRNAVLGHAVGLLCGWGALWLCGLERAGSALAAGVEPGRVLAVALALGGTGALCTLLGVVHAPAGATTLIVALGLITAPRDLVGMELAVLALTGVTLLLARLLGVRLPRWSAR